MKKYVIRTIAYTLVVMLLIGAIVYFIDPFIHFHAPFGNLSAVETEERSAMPGMARNMEYRTALIGSSMSENFQSSRFSETDYFQRTVKLCMEGAHMSDYSQLLDEVCARDTTKKVIFTLDNYLIINNPAEYPTSIPSYLSDHDITNDSSYLWNKSVLFYYLPKFIIENAKGETEDTAYLWGDEAVFDKYAARASYIPLRKLQKLPEEPYDTYFAFADTLISQLSVYIEARPDVEFIFFVPPYSIMYWDDCVNSGRLTAEICAMDRVYSALLTYENVRMFYFQDCNDIMENLDNYKDYSHYSPEINQYMFECFLSGDHEITKETEYDTVLTEFNYLNSYYYESIFH